MEKRLELAIREKDFYSAQQMVLSQMQRLERSGRYLEEKEYLYSGILSLDEAHAPAAIIFDLVARYLSLLRSFPPETPETEGPRLVNMLSIVLDTKDNIPIPLENFWIEVASWAIDHGCALECFETLLKSNLGMDRVLSLALQKCPHIPAVFGLLGSEEIGEGLFLEAGLSLISQLCFGSCRALMESTVATNVNLFPPGLTIANRTLYDEDGSQRAKCFNLLTFLSELLQRQAPPREMFVELQLRYSEILKRQQVKRIWSHIRDSFWPKPAQSEAVNPLASLLQSMLSSGSSG